ncbi:MAG TPA: GNAT family protein [Streptosporangiaceae bacterium]
MTARHLAFSPTTRRHLLRIDKASRSGRFAPFPQERGRVPDAACRRRQVHEPSGTAEIGYGVRGCERGKGYASEALAAVARWALTEGGIQRAWMTANTDNLASVWVAEKAGFRREGTLRRAGLEDDGLHDLAIFSLLDDEV